MIAIVTLEILTVVIVVWRGCKFDKAEVEISAIDATNLALQYADFVIQCYNFLLARELWALPHRQCRQYRCNSAPTTKRAVDSAPSTASLE